MFGVVGLFPDLVLQSRLARMDKILSTLGLPRIRPFGASFKRVSDCHCVLWCLNLMKYHYNWWNNDTKLNYGYFMMGECERPKNTFMMVDL